MSEDCYALCPEFDRDIFTGLRILVVDDTQDHLLLTRYILESYGIQVITASNANEAFNLIKHESVNLLISDINMPGESGYSLIQRIRTLASPQTRDIPAIALSGDTQMLAHQQALDSGFQVYLQKPFNSTQLITEIAKLLYCSHKSSSSLFREYSYLLKK